MSRWPKVALGDVATITKGVSYTSDGLDSSGRVMVNLKNIGKGGGFKSEGNKFYSGDVKQSHLLEGGELLIAYTDLTKAKEILGCPVIVPRATEYTGACFSMDLGKIEPDSSKLDRNFLAYVLQSRDARAYMKANGSGATVMHLRTSAVPAFMIPMPPLDEQERIVAKLDAAMLASSKLLDNVNTQDNLARTLTSAVAASAVAELTGPEAPLVEVASVDYGTRLTRKKDGGTKYPVYGGGGETFRTDSWNRKDCYIVSRFAMSEECVRFVGGKFFLNDSGLSVATSDETVLQQDFLNTYLLAKSAEIYALGRGAAQRNLDVPAFKSMQIPVPTRAEQERFVAKVEGLRQKGKRLTALHEQKRSALSELNRAILSSLLQEQP